MRHDMRYRIIPAKRLLKSIEEIDRYTDVEEIDTRTQRRHRAPLGTWRRKVQ